VITSVGASGEHEGLGLEVGGEAEAFRRQMAAFQSAPAFIAPASPWPPLRLPDRLMFFSGCG
jgi:hypothetical protein